MCVEITALISVCGIFPIYFSTWYHEIKIVGLLSCASPLLHATLGGAPHYAAATHPQLHLPDQLPNRSPDQLPSPPPRSCTMSSVDSSESGDTTAPIANPVLPPGPPPATNSGAPVPPPATGGSSGSAPQAPPAGDVPGNGGGGFIVYLAPPPAVHPYATVSVKSHIPVTLTMKSNAYSRWTSFKSMRGKFGLKSHIDGMVVPRPQDPTGIKRIAASPPGSSPLQSRAIFLSHDFHSMMQGDSSIAEYCSRMKTLTDALRDVDHPVQDS
ncbi:uncharacterized protein C6orf132 homolog [Setaria italica]|uniref:uncharacterized protein C6orf132 homolog n=1 Tax=Setaria italica TaxID=4555 RepID=UPI0006476933|nr:uncharacterized protein C6orf132 homolog [Setaria italica]